MMKRFIFGFQRRVWCPKWTPLSRSWRMVTTAIVVLLALWLSVPSVALPSCWRVVVHLPGAPATPRADAVRSRGNGSATAVVRPAPPGGAAEKDTRIRPAETGRVPSLRTSGPGHLIGRCAANPGDGTASEG